jgi:VWFA-related protein
MRRAPRERHGSWLLLSAIVLMAFGPMEAQPGAQQPTFKSSVDLVQVRAVVRDRRGRFVRGLDRADFEVIDGGNYRPLVDLQFDTNAPLRVALLFDVSGSMSVAAKLGEAAGAARQLLAGLRPEDEAAVFAFDTSLRELQPFTSDRAALERAFEGLRAFGQTSIFDAAAETASRIALDRSRRQAIVIVTDGIDTRSRMSAEEVSAIASATDVPIYVFAVVSPLDHAGMQGSLVDDAPPDTDTALGRLAYWTGGTTHVASTPAHASIAARDILGELRHQYLLAFEPGPPGWRPLTVRATERGYSVRARTSYRSGPRSS